MKIRLLIALYTLLILGETIIPGLWPHAFTYLPPVIFWLPPALFFLFAARTKDRGRVLLSFACFLVVGLSPFGPSLGNGQSKDSNTFTVVSWNIKHGWQGAEEVVDYLSQTRADIMFLQEAQENLAIRLLSERLPNYYLVRSTETDNDVAVFTRFPIKKREPLPDFPGFNLIATLEVGSEEINLVNLHLGKASKSKVPVRSIWRTTALHREAEEQLLKHAKQLSGPLLIAGDFNAPSAAPVVRRLPLQEIREFGIGGTYPQPFPLWRLDHILINEKLRAESSWVDPVNFSDHRPVWARLSFR